MNKVHSNIHEMPKVWIGPAVIHSDIIKVLDVANIIVVLEERTR